MRRDPAFLDDIVRCADRIASLCAGLTLAELMSDEIRQAALLHNLTIIGEASNRITPETRTHHSDIPWADIVSQRNRIVRDYFGLDWILLWETITEGVPVLRRRAVEILAEMDQLPDEDSI